MITVFLCGSEPEDIFTAVYDAWASGLGHDHVRLGIREEYGQQDLFSVYRRVERDLLKAEKVARSVRSKISLQAYEEIYQAALSARPDRADAIYRFLIEGFRVGPDVIRRLQHPAVCRVFELSRKVGREAHLFRGFTRFREWENRLLLAVIAPRSNVLALIAPHFEDRLSGEHWMIYDELRHKAAVHPAGQQWFLMDKLQPEWEASLIAFRGTGEEWESLWRTFVSSVAIEPRTNLRLQQNLMPLWYRKHMTEHQKN